MKKLIRILFCLSLLLALSLTAAAAASAEDYDIWVNGERFTGDRMEIACGGGKATLSLPAGANAPYTLTLTDAVITKYATVLSEKAAIYSTCQLDVVVKGENKIVTNANAVAGIAAHQFLSLMGDGSLTVETDGSSLGIYAPGVLYCKMDGDLKIRGSRYGIYAIHRLMRLGTGNVEITDCETAVYLPERGSYFTFSGSGNTTLIGTKHGIEFGQGSCLELNGSGEVTVSGGSCGIYTHPGGDLDRLTIHLKGRETPVVISTANGAHAIENGEVSCDPARYKLSGSPDQNQVIYDCTDPIVSIPYDVWVNGEQFVSDKPIIACGGGIAVLEEPAAPGKPYTLILTDAEITNCFRYISRNNLAIYSGYDLDVVLKGKNTIAPGPELAIGIYPEKQLTLKGDGDLTIENKSGASGIIAYHGCVTVAMDGDLTIRGGIYGVYTNSSVDIAGKGNVAITGCGTAVKYGEYNRELNLTGSGNTELVGRDYGVWFEYESEIKLKGSGEVTVTGGKCGVHFRPASFYYEEGAISLNGRESPVTLSAANGGKAIENGILAGTHIKDYQITGKPNDKLVICTYQPKPPKTGDGSSPLLWALLAAASCAALFLLNKKRSIRP